MISRPTLVLLCAAIGACAGSQGARTSDLLFSTPEADLAREHAPDLYGQAELASAHALEAERQKDEPAADDYRTESRLWLAAAIVESERVQLDRRRAEFQGQEEHWAKQLARDQQAAAAVARDISRHEANAVALREAERLAALNESTTVSDATLDAVLARVRLNLALAQALGATDEQLLPLGERADLVARKRPNAARVAESLLVESEILIGQTRADWPEPRPGASTALVETASVAGFAADRLGSAVLIRSGRFFSPNGQVSSATVRRFIGLLEAFPHGPVACQVAVPELSSRGWSRRVAQLVDRLGRMDKPGRVSTSMAATESLAAGTVQCTFAAYRDP